MSRDWSDWTGREQSASDRVDPALAKRWMATFDLDSSGMDGLPDGAMPQGIHFALCTPDAPTAALGADGHPARDDSPDCFLPPVPLPRRMWASSDIAFHAAITVGAAILRTSRIVSVTPKSGRSGEMVFVDIAHDTHADGQLAVSETQTLVYREAALADAPLSPPVTGKASLDLTDWDTHRVLTPDPRLLLRYSALTFNTHRIHYDAPYARGEERYRGLVVHGPLTASLLLQLGASQLGDNRLTRFGFRGISPAIAGEPLHLAMRGSGEGEYEFGAFAADGRQVMKADAAI